MADSRETAWLRDELVLVLDLYVRQGKRPALEVRQTLDDALRSFRRKLEPTVGSLERRLMEFAGLDPEDATPDRLAVHAPERAIWAEFANDRARLRSEAKAVRTRVYDIVAFLGARTQPIEVPVTRTRFRVVECTPASVTYSRGMVATALLQEILGEVLDRAYRVERGSRSRSIRGSGASTEGSQTQSLRRSLGRTSSEKGCTTEWRGRLGRAWAPTLLASQTSMSEPQAWRTLLAVRGLQRLGSPMSPLTNRRLSPNASLSLRIRM